jgi:hypothetical protein
MQGKKNHLGIGNGKNAISRGHISAGNALFAISSLKIRTWTIMPLKVGIIATFRGLLSVYSAQIK